eukprot:SAG11_NODE_36185_length_263_cov_0.591463_1_plen_87_part_11
MGIHSRIPRSLRKFGGFPRLPNSVVVAQAYQQLHDLANRITLQQDDQETDSLTVSPAMPAGVKQAVVDAMCAVQSLQFFAAQAVGEH